MSSVPNWYRIIIGDLSYQDVCSEIESGYVSNSLILFSELMFRERPPYVDGINLYIRLNSGTSAYNCFILINWCLRSRFFSESLLEQQTELLASRINLSDTDLRLLLGISDDLSYRFTGQRLPSSILDSPKPHPMSLGMKCLLEMSENLQEEGLLYSYLTVEKVWNLWIIRDIFRQLQQWVTRGKIPQWVDTPDYSHIIQYTSPSIWVPFLSQISLDVIEDYINGVESTQNRNYIQLVRNILGDRWFHRSSDFRNDALQLYLTVRHLSPREQQRIIPNLISIDDVLGQIQSEGIESALKSMLLHHKSNIDLQLRHTILLNHRTTTYEWYYHYNLDDVILDSVEQGTYFLVFQDLIYGSDQYMNPYTRQIIDSSRLESIEKQPALTYIEQWEKIFFRNINIEE